MDFVGREAELNMLRAASTSARSAFVPIYGRRRIGKSALILQLLRERSGIYFLGKQAPADLQLREFLRVAATVLEEPLLAEVQPQGWRHALQLVTDRASSRKLVLALDEFQWIVAQSPELPSLLQEFWDLHWSGSGKILLILCGSYIGFMEREVLGSQSPLFGRRTAQLHLQPFGYVQAAEFHPRQSRTNQARLYFLCGGVPQYLKMLRDDSSIEEFIQEEILAEFSPLYREPDFLLREELRDLPNYYAILMVLARGTASMAEMAKGASLQERSTPYYVNQLVELGHVTKRYPLTEKAPTARQVRYQLADPLLRFWFRFVYPQQSSIRQLGPERAFSNLVKPHLPAFFGRCFEGLCREALAQSYARRGVPGFQVGEYWDKEVQIDVVGLRDDGRTDLGECKWGSQRSLKTTLAALEGKVAHYPNLRNATVGRHIFVREWSGSVPDGVSLHTLEQLYQP